MTDLQSIKWVQPLNITKYGLVGLVAICFVVAFLPTVQSLIDGPWQTEQEGHGPLIIAATLWLVWHVRDRIQSANVKSAPFAGWAILVVGLILLFLSRTQEVLTVEAFSAIPILAGCVLILAGWQMLRVLAFPICFLFFAVPMPDWLIDAATVPLKVFISDVVTEVLYDLGYPVAQNGVMIMIETYQLMVKDACSGMNSIFALSAIGVFYVYVFRKQEKLRSFALLAAIIPITIIANFLRVVALVLIAYYAGIDWVEGTVHDMTGLGLFVVALVLLLLFDGLLGLLGRVVNSRWSPTLTPKAGAV